MRMAGIMHAFTLNTSLNRVCHPCDLLGESRCRHVIPVCALYLSDVLFPQVSLNCSVVLVVLLLLVSPFVSC